MTLRQSPVSDPTNELIYSLPFLTKLLDANPEQKYLSFPRWSLSPTPTFADRYRSEKCFTSRTNAVICKILYKYRAREREFPLSGKVKRPASKETVRRNWEIWLKNHFSIKVCTERLVIYIISPSFAYIPWELARYRESKQRMYTYVLANVL